MEKEKFIEICRNKFASRSNPQVPVVYKKMYEDVLWEMHDYWLQRHFPLAAELYASEVYDYYNSPLFKALE